jgi:hypothetical protein
MQTRRQVYSRGNRSDKIRPTIRTWPLEASRGRSRREQFAAGQRRSATSARTESSTTLLAFWETRIDQLPYLCQVMVIVLRNKIQMIHEPHGLLETRMQTRSRKNVRFKCPETLH